MSETFLIPGDALDPWTGKVGKSLVMPYGVYGRLPQRTGEDMLRSLKKHTAEVLDERGNAFLAGVDPDNGEPTISDTWEVRLSAERGAFRWPYAFVSAIGPELSVGPAVYADITQPVNIQLYPWPAQTQEHLLLVLSRLQTLMHDALKWGAARGREMCVPLWDHGGAPNLYDDTEARLQHDFVRVIDLQTDKIVDPSDEKRGFVAVNFRARWRRVPTDLPGHLVQSVRMTAHPD